MLVSLQFKLEFENKQIVKAKSLPKEKSVVFGGKSLFEKLCKNHLQGNAREKLKKEWKEKRQVALLSIGTKHESHKGNLCLRFENNQGKLEAVLKILRYTRAINSELKRIQFEKQVQKAWQVYFSSLKPLLVQGKWKRRTSRLVPFGFGGMLRNTW